MSDTHLNMFVAGRPAPQGSKRFLGVGRPPIESSKYVKPWRADIRDAAIVHYKDAALDGPLTVYLLFYMPRPASTPKSYTPFAKKRPDLDKLIRAVLDALSSAGVWTDDARVVEISAAKVIANGTRTGVHIVVRSCTSNALGEDRP